MCFIEQPYFNRLKLKNFTSCEDTGVVRNFDLEGPKVEKFYDVSLVTFFDDEKQRRH